MLTELAPDIHFTVHAACRRIDPEVFFPAGYAGEHQGLVLQAKAVCAHCPVTEACLETALSSDQQSGIWGGLTPLERIRLRRGRRGVRS
ncbi:MAG: hypothetical protein NVS3B26_02750 [Mycobacteriales bacterium]